MPSRWYKGLNFSSIYGVYTNETQQPVPYTRETADPQPRGKGQDRRSLTSNVTPTPYLHRHPYAKTTQTRAFTTNVTLISFGENESYSNSEL